MKQVNQIIPSVSTAVSAPQTQVSPRNIADWGKWLKLDLHDDQVVAMANCCADFVLALKQGQSPRWISLLGKSGIGKTHCAKRMWKFGMERADWREISFLAGMIYWPEFVSQLRSGDAFKKLRSMMNWPILFLDDIGAERDTTGFASEQLNMLIGRREHKWTIITSNLTIQNLAEIEPRVADRIIRPPNIFIEANTESHALRLLRSRSPHNAEVSHGAGDKRGT